jgi:hypothetical protein
VLFLAASALGEEAMTYAIGDQAQRLPWDWANRDAVDQSPRNSAWQEGPNGSN